MNLRKVWKTPSGNLIIRLDLPMWKSDRFGKRFFSKTMDIPSFLSIQEIWAMLQCPPKYWTLLQAIKQISPHLSVHSLRRGAVSALAGTFENHHILLLTGHSTKNESCEIRRYTEPTTNNQEALVQRQMVNFLAEGINRNLTARKLLFQ